MQLKLYCSFNASKSCVYQYYYYYYYYTNAGSASAEISAGDVLTKHCSLLTWSVESDGGVIDVKAMTLNVLT